MTIQNARTILKCCQHHQSAFNYHDGHPDIRASVRSNPQVTKCTLEMTPMYSLADVVVDIRVEPFTEAPQSVSDLSQMQGAACLRNRRQPISRATVIAKQSHRCQTPF